MLENVPDTVQSTHGIRKNFADIRNVATGVPCDNEYVVHSFSRWFFAAQYIAEYTTFSTAFKQPENLKFLRAKGSFKTCELCNSLNNLLKNTHKKLKKKEQVQIVQEFKRLHNIA